MPKEQLKVPEFPGYFSGRTRAPRTPFPGQTLTPNTPTQLLLGLSACGCSQILYPLACCSCYFGCCHIWPGATRAGQVTCYCPQAVRREALPGLSQGQNSLIVLQQSKQPLALPAPTSEHRCSHRIHNSNAQTFPIPSISLHF